MNQQSELPLPDPEATPSPVTVAEGDLKQTVAEYRRLGLEPWRMDVLRSGYRLYFRRSVAVEGGYD